MIRVVAKSKVKPGRMEEMKRLYMKLIPEVLKERGCHFYGLFEDLNDPDCLAILEEWEDTASLDAHAKMQHMKDFAPLLSDCRDSVTVEVYKAINNN
jgi:quinol monooxygenase YgiN